MDGALSGIGIIIMLVGGAWIVLAFGNAPPTTYGTAAAILLAAPAIGTVITGLLVLAFGHALRRLRRIDEHLASLVYLMERQRD